MKTKPLFLLIFICLLAMACKSDDDVTSCGCEGNIVFTIEDGNQQVGYLYKNTDNSSENLPDYNYGIWFSEVNCSNCVHNFLVCNDNFLLGYEDIIPPYPGIEVEFSGKAMELCLPPFAPGDYTYNYIILTKTE